MPLGGRGGAVSSVLHLARDGRVTVGEAAASLAGIDPTRVVRGLKRRVGDAAPVMLGGQPWAAEELSARLVRWVVDRVVEKEGEPPAKIARSRTRCRGRRTRSSRLASALAGQDLGVTFVAEPRAVAHAAVGAAKAGATVAVHDFGGGRFDAAVLRRAGMPGGGFAVLGVPEAIDDLGGLDLDELVWQHVRTSLPDDVTPVARVRRACTLAKETLSSENEVVVRIRYGDFRGAVRLDRPTFEGLIAPHVDRTVDALRRTIAAAGVEPGQLTALLLVGGSARIPLLARTVTEQLGCVPTVHGDEDLVARGAVFALSAPTGDVVAPTTSGLPAIPSRAPTRKPTAADGAEAPTVVLAVPAVVDAPTTPLLLSATVEPPPRRLRYRRHLIARDPWTGHCRPRSRRPPHRRPQPAPDARRCGRGARRRPRPRRPVRSRRPSRPTARSRGRERDAPHRPRRGGHRADGRGAGPERGRHPYRGRSRCGTHGPSRSGRHPPVGDHHPARPPEPVEPPGRHPGRLLGRPRGPADRHDSAGAAESAAPVV